MGLLTTQLRQIVRRLARAPMFTAVTLLTLVVGIGANTAIFSVVEGVLLKPLPYPHPEELVTLKQTAPGWGGRDVYPPAANYFIYREQGRTFQEVGLYSAGLNASGYTVNVAGLGEPEHLSALIVTDGVLSILGVTPLLGRSFTREDDAPGSAETVILTYGLLEPQVWRRPFRDRKDDRRGWQAANDHRRFTSELSLPGQDHPCLAAAHEIKSCGDLPRRLHSGVSGRQLHSGPRGSQGGSHAGAQA